MNKFWLVVFHTMLISSLLMAFMLPWSHAAGFGVCAALAWAGIAITRNDILEERVEALEKRLSDGGLNP